MDPLVDRLQRRSAEDVGAIPLSGGLPSPETFPREALKRAFDHMMRDPSGEALQYGWPEGRATLRALVAERMRARGADVRAADVIITSGAQQAIAIATQAVCRRGDAIAVDALSYPAALDTFRAYGVVPKIDPTDAAAFYTMPAISNPLGCTMTATERARVLAGRRPIIEDDAYADLCFDGLVPPPMLAKHRENVLYVGSFSKTLCPGLRVGYLIPPPGSVEGVTRLKQAHDLQANSLAQSLVEAYLLESDFDGHLIRLRTTYARRMDRLATALRESFPSFAVTEPRGGFSVWVETNATGDERAFLQSAVEHGTSFDPGSDFRATASTASISFRLSFASAPEHELEEGVRRLRRAWDAVGAEQKHARRSALA